MGQMKMEEIKPTRDALSVLLRTYVESGLLIKPLNFDIAQKVYEEMAKRGDRESLSLDNYSTAIMKGDTESANVLFKELKLKGFLPTVETYGAIINGFCKEGNFMKIDHLLMEMKERGLNINVQIYNNVINARYMHGLVVKIEETLKTMIESGCEPDITTYNILITESCREGKIQKAKQQLEEAIKRGQVSTALTVREKMMDKGLQPDSAIYNVLMNGLCKEGRNGSLNDAIKLFDLAIEKGIEPGVVGYNAMIKGYCKAGLMTDALLCVINEKGRPIPDEYSYSTIMMALWMDRNFAAYNSILVCLCLHDMVRTALQLHDKMKNKSFFMDSVSFSSLLYGICKEERSHEWRNLIPCTLNERELEGAVRYLLKMDQYLPKGATSKAMKILQSLVEDSKSYDQVEDHRISVR
ncbi:hypothetical protein F8388_027044 [Cannabis sativa]|uniref:Pentatricopeptide repeat-containing protein n=1 Tax=Cannabis sativa TaxID=3483 RepID=A0A7J6FNS9_CANSA|nr:hypothetical protein F8388_027044 [Cannabis sativa]